MLRRILPAAFFIVSFTCLHAQDLNLFAKKVFVSNGDSLLYRILLPQNFNPAKKYPLILFLHGSGERGADNEKQLVHGADLFVRDDIRKNFPAIVVFPQCPQEGTWANYKIRDSSGTRIFSLQRDAPTPKAALLLDGLISELKSNYKIASKRMYVGGLSMGGMGTFDLVRRHPKMFAAAFPICGAADVADAKSGKKISWWIFHGAKDNVVPPESSIQMAAALKKEKAKVRFTLYPKANHNSWDPAFAEKDLLPWLFAQHK